MFNSASGMLSIDFKSIMSSLNGRTSLAAVDRAIYSASVVLRAISVCRWLKYIMEHPAYLITQPVLDLTEFSSSHVSLE